MPPYASTRWDEIIPGLYMGGHDWMDRAGTGIGSVIVDREFDLVLSLYERYGHGPAVGVERRNLRIPDGVITADEVGKVREFADLGAHAVRTGRKVLARCQAGYNRSGLLTAFILLRLGWGADCAIDLIRERRSRYALCNGNFVELVEAEQAHVVHMAGMVGLARDVATEAHAGQVDKAGKPYIDHPAAVAKALEPYGPHAVMAGWLHDVVEDSNTTLGDLLRMGFPHIVVGAVDSVTRRDGELYRDLIARAAAHPLGRRVKLADTAHNSSPDRLAALDEPVRLGLARRYAKARAMLLDAEEASRG